MTRWHANVAFRTTGLFSHDTAFDVLEAMSQYAAAVAPYTSNDGGEVSFSITSETITDACKEAVHVITKTITAIAGHPTIESVEIATEEKIDQHLAEPAFPEVVGYAEIADMAGVSRQRARQFAQYEDFPAPVITTAQGPLMTKVTVENWLANRNTRVGRPKATT